jgi:hypothetical protein
MNSGTTWDRYWHYPEALVRFLETVVNEWARAEDES